MTTWYPNGLGAGTDNDIVGGGGGFMSYPQPPTGPKAGLVPAENNGQFGAFNANLYNYNVCVYQVINNPGRSQNQ